MLTYGFNYVIIKPVSLIGNGDLVHCIVTHFSIFNFICHVSAQCEMVSSSLCEHCESHYESMVLYTIYIQSSGCIYVDIVYDN